MKGDETGEGRFLGCFLICLISGFVFWGLVFAILFELLEWLKNN